MKTIAILGVVMLALAVSGCGRRGRLEPPPNPSNPFQPNIDQQTTPQPQAQAQADGKGVPDKSKLGTHKRPKNVPITPPHESFILDPLL